MHHHPSDQLLLEHASGLVPSALGMLVACHVEDCEACSAKYRKLESVVAELVIEGEADAVDESLLTSILGSLDEERIYEKPIAPVEGIPRPLWRLLPEGLSSVQWKGFFNSVKTSDLETGDKHFTTRFYKIKAGSQLPMHSHRGSEYTLVLKGSFSDGLGTYRAGDFVEATTETEHKPVAGAEEDCICLAVMDAPIKFNGWKGVVLNPLMS